MTPAERAALNRRAAELAGWTFTPAATEQGPGVEIVSPAGTRMLAWDGRGADFCAPNIMGSPALWWPLVERMARLVEERRLTAWLGPCYLPGRETRSGEPHWWVEFDLPATAGERLSGPDPGAVVVRAALAVAEALGLRAAD